MEEVKCIISGFDTKIEVVDKLQRLIETKYNDLFYAVLVHGSVATNEIIPYSDFDGLLIVKDSFVDSKQLKSFKKESMKIIYSFDPLQHHGWFQILESDLYKYPESYLPVTILEHAKLIFPKDDCLELRLRVPLNIDYKSTLINMLNQFEKREEEHWRPNNIFQLKSVLSQIMLVPCLYYSAMYSEGIFKRESFLAVKSKFTEDEWMPIETATEIRGNWNYSLTGLQRSLLVQSNPKFRKIATRLFAPKIPTTITEQLDQNFYNNLMLLTKAIKSEVL
ncbi:hypothetical protein BXY82_0289 [Gelidibacter sediminis]|uniref:Uncharacterized protein n=1 Tax=Gelidibacter sediminis TaxID=1608710 RepID=A0A4R7Q835_9FLAO|nr:nucleotidyltransferase domain-containing protein [Gelidibacter sediminis]TDU42890.1 hypothetical protein BXY82_0289 [Gelidibacter sediminis]